MRHFKDTICVITGAGSGIGAACAQAMAREGALIIGTDLRQDMLAETKARIEAAGGAMENFMVDVADRDAMFDLAATVEKQYGPADLILNNAGVAFGAPVAEMQIDDFKWLMDINFWGVVNGTQAFLPHMISKGSGHVANISSIFGLISVPTKALIMPPNMVCWALPMRCATKCAAPALVSAPFIRAALIPILFAMPAFSRARMPRPSTKKRLNASRNLP